MRQEEKEIVNFRSLRLGTCERMFHILRIRLGDSLCPTEECFGE